MPHWCEYKEDAFEALVKKWLGENEEFNAVSERNRANRGTGGTHSAGSLSTGRYKAKLVHIYMEEAAFYFPSCSHLITHNISLAMQETKLKRTLTDMEAWEKMKQKNPDLTQPQPSFPEYFGNAEENTRLYYLALTSLRPEVEDSLEVETDERAMMVAGAACRMAVLYALVRCSGHRGPTLRSRLASPPATPLPCVLDSLVKM